MRIRIGTFLLVLSFAGLGTLPAIAGSPAGCPPDDPDAVCGTDGDDHITIDSSDDPELDRFVHVYLGDGDDTVCIEVLNGIMVLVEGGTGDKFVTVKDCPVVTTPSGDAPSVVIFFGGPGDDVVLGGPYTDTIHGGGGADRLDGRNGRDRIQGGTGADVVMGGQGRDRLWGGDGDDELRGGFGLDTLRGGSGVDACDGGPEVDIEFGCES